MKKLYLFLLIPLLMGVLAPPKDDSLSIQTQQYLDSIPKLVSDETYGSSWDGVTTISPSKNAVYDKFNSLSAGDMSYSDTRFKTGNLTRDISLGAGTQAVTGVGFRPKALLMIAAVDSAAGKASWGFSIGGALTATIVDDHLRNPNCFLIHGGVVEVIEGANDFIYAEATFDDDGFTLTWTVGGGAQTGTLGMAYLAIR